MLFRSLGLFGLQLRGFTNQEIRGLLAPLLGFDQAHYPIGKMTYDLRRLRLHRIIERIPHSHTYRITTTTTLRYCTVNCVGSTTAWASAL